MKIEDNTLVFIVDTKVNKHQIKQPMKKLCHTDVAKVSTLIRLDEEKKACVPRFLTDKLRSSKLSPAQQQTESSWLILTCIFFSPIFKK